MGLDSVELVMEIEKYFNIQIPDPEAEKISTVQDMVDCVSRHLSLTDTSTELRDNLFRKVEIILKKIHLLEKNLDLATPIFHIINPNQKEKWGIFKRELGLKVPDPYIKKNDSQGLWGKIKTRLSMGYPLYEWEQITVEHFIAVIHSRNIEEFISPGKVKSVYEIYVAVMNITVAKIGVDEYEITPEKSFTNDLGVD